MKEELGYILGAGHSQAQCTPLSLRSACGMGEKPRCRAVQVAMDGRCRAGGLGEGRMRTLWY